VEDNDPNPIDRHVGARVRLRRKMLKMSQETLGEALGVTFQQVQKYERGANRIGASRLFRTAQVLQVPVGYFFEGLDVEGGPTVQGFAEDDQTPLIYDFIASPEGVALASAFGQITDPQVRRRVLELVRALAGPGPGAAKP
jgi:transcriptional regulator with XRE-family HTH domain